MFWAYIPIFICSMITIAATIGLYLLRNYSFLKKMPYLYFQIVVGVIFGAIAILGTEFGADVGGAVINVRDAAPLSAAIVFGGPAGLIAGLIGGLERFFAAYWGRGTYTQIACSISTLLAGVFGALLRRFIFNKRVPPWIFGLVTGAVMESFHLSLIFLTHISEPYEVLELLRIIAFPMIFANAITLLFVTVGIFLFDYFRNRVPGVKKKKIASINERLQTFLLLVVSFGYALSNVFIIIIQNNYTDETVNNILYQATFDIEERILDYSYANLNGYLTAFEKYYEENPSMSLAEMQQTFKEEYEIDLVQINLITRSGIVQKSSDPTNVGYEMEGPDSTEQSRSFHRAIMDDGVSYIQEFYNIDGRYTKYAGKMIQNLSNFNGYLQVAIDVNGFYSTGISDIIRDYLTKLRHVYYSGYIVILDYNNNIVSDLSGKDPYMINTSNEKLASLVPYSRYRDKIFKNEVVNDFYMYSPIETYNIVVSVPETDFTNGRDLNLFVFNFTQLIIFALIFVFIYKLIEHLVVRNINKINETLSLIIAGDLDQIVDVRNTSEFDRLSTDINFTVQTLKKFIEKAASRIDAELAFAKKVQISSLPTVFPPYPALKSFDIYATMNTARQVGGDFYDFYLSSHFNLYFLVADVSGKGIPASMFMMESKTLLKNYATMGKPLDEIFTLCNNDLSNGNDANMFVTCWMGYIDTRTGIVKFANAGHNYPAVYRHKAKTWELLKQKKNLVLAGLEGINYDIQELKLEKGDRIFLYTDGLTEATREDDVLYGEERLLAYLNSHSSLNQKELLKGIQEDIDAFIDGAEQFDDITMLILDYHGNQD